MMMLEMKTTKFLEELSSKAPVPGGGGASAAVGAFGAALGMMVANLTGCLSPAPGRPWRR